MWIEAVVITCVIASSLQYDVGVNHKYSYQFTILLNEDSNITSRSASVGRSVGYQVASEFVISGVWQSSLNPKEKLLKLELLQPTLLVSSSLHSPAGINRHWSKLDNLSYPPIYIHWEDGLVKKVYVLPDTLSMVNIKKGIASLLQLKVSQDPVNELDVSGLCEVRYKVSGYTIKKTKSNCVRSSKNHNMLKKDQLRSSTVSTSSELTIALSPENVIQSVTGKEEVMMTLNLWKQAAVFVKTKMNVKYIESYKSPSSVTAKNVQAAVDIISKEMGSKLVKESLEAAADKDACIGNCQSLRDSVLEYGKNLIPEHLGKVKSAAGFLKLLDTFRRASKKELLLLFKDANEKILTQLLDVLAATQTEDALEVAFELVDFESKDIDIAERFLICLATVPYPNEFLISRTFKLLGKNIQSEKLRATILVTLSSLVRTFCKNDEKNKNSLIVQSINDFLLRELKGCDHILCILDHLLAMRNAAQPQYLPVLLEYVKKGGMTGLVALEAIKDIGVNHFTKEVKDTLFRVYHQFWPQQESAARVMAAEMLIKSQPTLDTIGNIILSLTDREQPEISTLVLKKLYNAMEESEAVRSCMTTLLQNSTFGNYDNLAQNGSSTSYVKLLQATHDADIMYGINMEMRKTGMLKRTSLDLHLQNAHDHMQLVSLGLFVEGFGLTEEEEKASPEEHSAGMQLSVLGVHLRPYIFFKGTGELMGLVWSGAGSEPTPALQANFLFMDQSYSVVLQSGIAVDFVLKGALSADISGTVEVSMWNKNSHAKVINSGALLVNGFCRVDTSFVESRVDFALGGSSSLDMAVDLDFAEKPMKICLQVEQPGYVFRHNVRKTETIPGSKHLIKTLKRRSIHFPSKSFNLHKKNSESCKVLLFPKPQTSYW